MSGTGGQSYFFRLRPCPEFFESGFEIKVTQGPVLQKFFTPAPDLKEKSCPNRCQTGSVATSDVGDRKPTIRRPNAAHIRICIMQAKVKHPVKMKLHRRQILKSGFFFKENVRYPVWICRDPISLILGT